MYHENWTQVRLYRRHVNGFLCEIQHGPNAAGGASWKWTITRSLAGASNLPTGTGHEPTLNGAMRAAEAAAQGAR